jgi:hypothetical protein
MQHTHTHSHTHINSHAHTRTHITYTHTYSEENKAIEQLYNRTVTLDTRECALPDPLEPALFTSPGWDIRRLMQAKKELNTTKDKLNKMNLG